MMRMLHAHVWILWGKMPEHALRRHAPLPEVSCAFALEKLLLALHVHR